MTLSIIVPCFNEEKCIAAFIESVNELNLSAECEFVFVDDGSSDTTLNVIKSLANNDDRIRFISFSRNFGKEAAILAGLRHATGDYVVTMDVDLQDPPALLKEMLSEIREGRYDCVATRRISRDGEPLVRSWFARRFYWLMRTFSDIPLVDGARDYRMMTRQVVDAILSLSEVNRFTKGIYQWVGFNTKWLEFPNVERTVGETKWSFFKLFLYSLEGILAFTTAPLQIASILGLLSCFVSFVSLVFIVTRALWFGDPVNGWPSLACIVIFFGGIQLFVIGILGTYLAKTYLESKRRPIFIVKEKR